MLHMAKVLWRATHCISAASGKGQPFATSPDNTNFAHSTAIKFSRSELECKEIVPYEGAVKKTVFSSHYPQEVPKRPALISFKDLKSRSGQFKFVVQDGKLLVGEPGTNHIDLAQGRPVEIAGQINILAHGPAGDGVEVLWVNNGSGHYQPGAEIQEAAEAAFRKIGMDVIGKFRPVVWHDPLYKWIGWQYHGPSGTEFRPGESASVDEPEKKK
jgi:hypothetical protein